MSFQALSSFPSQNCDVGGSGVGAGVRVGVGAGVRAGVGAGVRAGAGMGLRESFVMFERDDLEVEAPIAKACCYTL